MQMKTKKSKLTEEEFYKKYEAHQQKMEQDSLQNNKKLTEKDDKH